MALIDFFFSEPKQSVQVAKVVTPIKKNIQPTSGLPQNIPTGRKSVPADNVHQAIGALSTEYKVITPTTFIEYIPIIRKLVQLNPDLSQALDNIVSLGNTGHKVFFDRGVDEEEQDRMRRHLNTRAADSWATGLAGMDGVVNRMFSQLLIGGALSGEWVPNTEMTGIESYLSVNPEEIRFVLDNRETRYKPYQLTRNKIANKPTKPLIKLNPNTYKYFALNGDGEVPYGTPFFLPTIMPLERQKTMNDNIDYVIAQLGLLGFLSVLITKPDQGDEENDEDYRTRLMTYLAQSKESVGKGYKDGAVIGYKDDHEFEFHSLGKEFGDALKLFQENEQQVASGAKQDVALWGRGYATSETQITVVFMKLLSQLRNMQNIIKTMLEFGYALELRLAGFKFEFLTVKFNPSTIQDDLKIRQAEEINIRNVLQKYLMGLISQEQAADELGYETPDQKEPRVPVEMLAGGKNPAEEEEASQKREKGKDTSDRKAREKKKP